MEEDEDDNTRVVARPEPSATDDHEDDHTRVVQRESEAPATADEDDATRVVKHAADADAGDDDNTRVVARDPKQHSLTLPASGRRRGIALPPAMESFSADVELARGAGAVEAYPAREIPEPPPPPPPTEEGPEATRAPAPSMPSVSRRSRVAARAALSVFVSSCVLAVAGIIVAVVLLL